MLIELPNDVDLDYPVLFFEQIKVIHGADNERAFDRLGGGLFCQRDAGAFRVFFLVQFQELVRQFRRFFEKCFEPFSVEQRKLIA